MSEIVFREYRPGDEAAILATFNQTFREVVGPSFTDREPARWRWEFMDNPAGWRILLGLAGDGRVACQYAGVPMRVHVAEGKRTLSFFHAVDSMVHPDFRNGLSKRPLFVEVAERFFERYGGRDDHLGFGYPVRPAWRIGERYLGYGLVRSLDFMLRPCGGPLDLWGVRVEMLQRFPDEVDALFAGLADCHACVTVKDARYLNWRYGDCPDVDYRVFWAHRSVRPAGFMVVRFEGGLVPNTATIGDLLVDPSDVESLKALLSFADNKAADVGCRYLMTVQNPRLPAGQHLQQLGFELEPSAQWFERKLGSRDWTSGLSQQWLAENWSYTLGDSDLF